MTETQKWADEAMRLKNEIVDVQAVNAQLLWALEAITDIFEKTGPMPSAIAETARAAIKAATEG